MVFGQKNPWSSTTKTCYPYTTSFLEYNGLDPTRSHFFDSLCKAKIAKNGIKKIKKIEPWVFDPRVFDS